MVVVAGWAAAWKIGKQCGRCFDGEMRELRELIGDSHK